MSFAALQTRVNTTALQRLGAGGAITLDGTAVDGDFTDPAGVAYLDGASADASTPQVVVLSSIVPASVFGKTVVANSTSYKVVGDKPDGFGLTTLVLELMV